MRKIIEILIIAGILGFLAFPISYCRADSYLQFNGSTGYVDTDQTFQAVFRDSFLICVWAKPADGQPPSSQVICGYNSNVTDEAIDLAIATNGKVVLSVTIPNVEDTGFTDIAVFSNGQQSNFTFISATFSVTGLDYSIKIYVNGVLAGQKSGTAAGAISCNNNLVFFIGADNINGDDMGLFSGSLDDFRLYAKALSQSEITAIYNNGKGTKYPDGIATAAYALNMNEGSGTTVTDVNSGTLTGTLYGGVEWRTGGVPFGNMTATGADVMTVTEAGMSK